MNSYSESIINVVGNITKNHPHFLNYIREKRFHIADTPLTYRQLNVLEQANLLEDTRESSSDWHSFSLNDLLYLQIVSEFKTLNTNNTQLKFIKGYFYKQYLPYSSGNVLFSEIALIALLLEVVPVCILLYSDGEVVFTDNPSTPFLQNSLDTRNRKYIFIYLYEAFKPILAKLKGEEPVKVKYNLVDYGESYLNPSLTQSDRMLTKLIKSDEFSKVIIEKKKDGTIVLTGEVSKDGNNLTETDIVRLAKINNFGDTTFKRRDGKIVSYTLSSTMKL